MELHQFLEKDMVEFLEERTGQEREKLGRLRAEEFNLYTIERDYAKETQKALEKGDLHLAKKIFHELRNAYNQAEANDTRREQIYAILQEVYTKIKNYLRAQERDEGNLEEELKNIGRQQFTLTQEEKQAKEQREAFEKAAHEAIRIKEELDAKMQAKIEAVSKKIHEKDLKGAIEAYKILKTGFNDYPSEDRHRKVKWYNEVLRLYEVINNQHEEEQAKKKEKEAQEEKKRKEEEERKKAEEAQKREEAQTAHQKKDQEQLTTAKVALKALIKDLEKKDIHQLEKELLQTKHLLSTLDEHLEEQKRPLEDLIITVNHKIQFLKQTQQQESEEEKKRKEEEEAKKRREAQEEEQKKAEEAKKRREAQEEEQKKAEEAKKKEQESRVNIKEDEDTEEIYNQAVRLQHAGNYTQAQQYYQEVLKRRPHHLPAQIRLEQIKEQQSIRG